MKIKKGDTVEVISGNDKGVRGTVNTVMRAEGKLIVSGVKMIKKHQRRTGAPGSEGGIIEREAPIQVSNVEVVCSHCDKPSRVGYDFSEDGTKVRICRRCKEALD